jgi:hypothetical protein
MRNVWPLLQWSGQKAGFMNFFGRACAIASISTRKRAIRHKKLKSSRPSPGNRKACSQFPRKEAWSALIMISSRAPPRKNLNWARDKTEWRKEPAPFSADAAGVLKGSPLLKVLYGLIKKPDIIIGKK